MAESTAEERRDFQNLAFKLAEAEKRRVKIQKKVNLSKALGTNLQQMKDPYLAEQARKRARKAALEKYELELIKLAAEEKAELAKVEGYNWREKQAAGSRIMTARIKAAADFAISGIESRTDLVAEQIQLYKTIVQSASDALNETRVPVKVDNRLGATAMAHWTKTTASVLQRWRTKIRDGEGLSAAESMALTTKLNSTLEKAGGDAQQEAVLMAISYELGVEGGNLTQWMIDGGNVTADGGWAANAGNPPATAGPLAMFGQRVAAKRLNRTQTQQQAKEDVTKYVAKARAGGVSIDPTLLKDALAVFDIDDSPAAAELAEVKAELQKERGAPVESRLSRTQDRVETEIKALGAPVVPQGFEVQLKRLREGNYYAELKALNPDWTDADIRAHMEIRAMNRYKSNPKWQRLRKKALRLAGDPGELEEMEMWNAQEKLGKDVKWAKDKVKALKKGTESAHVAANVLDTNTSLPPDTVQMQEQVSDGDSRAFSAETSAISNPGSPQISDFFGPGGGAYEDIALGAEGAQLPPSQLLLDEQERERRAKAIEQALSGAAAQVEL